MPFAVLICLGLFCVTVFLWRKIGSSKTLDDLIESCIEPDPPKKDPSDFERQGKKLYEEMTEAERKAEREKKKIDAKAEKLKATKESVFFNKKEGEAEGEN